MTLCMLLVDRYGYLSTLVDYFKDIDLSKKTLTILNEDNGAVIPTNLIPHRFAMDNTDIKDHTFSGLGKF